MRLHPAAGWRSLLYSTLLISSVLAKKDKPSVKSTKFDFVPYNVNYFDDSDVLLFEDGVSHNVWRSEDAGETWSEVESIPNGVMLEVSMHPFDKKRAYIITNAKSHWMTSDRGKTWKEFFADSQASIFRQALTYHAGDPDRIIFNAMDCTGIFCEELSMYTTNGFSTDAKFLRSDTAGCHWAKTTDLFTTGQKDLDADRILCVVKGRFSPWRKDYRLLVSDNFFTENKGDAQEFEPELESGRTVQGIVDIAETKKFLIAAATTEGTDEMALYVTDDTIKWHRAIFPQKVRQEAYTVLESTNYSIQIDVMNARPSNPMGIFFNSNSNGTYFTQNIEHTNRNIYGLVDFEKVSGIQGIVLVNIVDNWEDVEQGVASKNIKTRISFDDGRTWEGIKIGEEDLHLHSVTDLSNVGRVFSSPAPGIVMGIGNTGKYLKDYMDGNLYVSDDAGLTWRHALDGPHKYEIGDQGSVLVAIENGLVDEMKFSLDHGKKWETFKLDLEEKIKPMQLTTTQDSTSLKFFLEGITDDRNNAKGYIVAIDFEDMHEKKCKKGDFEDWWARVDKDGKPTCVMGQMQKYRRRKADADCFVKEEFVDPVPDFEPCECTQADFECDYNYIKGDSEDGPTCSRAKGVALALPDGACKAFGPEDTFMGTSGWRKIPGNACERTKGKQLDDPIEHKCVDVVGPPSSGQIDHVAKPFRGQNFLSKHYLERTGISTGEDETVLVLTEAGVFISTDHGQTWEQILEDEVITAIYPHRYFNDMVFFLTPTEKVFYSTERGKHIRSFNAPFPPNDEDLPTMNFHPKNKDWIIWIGKKDCGSEEGCHSEAYVTKDRGDDKWTLLQRYVRRCEFVYDNNARYRSKAEKEEQLPRDKLIFCEVRLHERVDTTDNPLRLVSSKDFFEDEEEQHVHFTDVVDFATMEEFVVVATKDSEHETLRVDASVDGINFAPAKFPHDFEIPHQRGYTVLDSSTHSIFLHVTVDNDQGFEYGTIMKSNSNGTSYVRSLDGVNRDKPGYVDFEKMSGIEGVAMVNVVANINAKDFTKDGKKLRSMITHNDGAEWDYLSPPEKDPDGKKYNCKGCALHIHSYTERRDKSHIFSSQSAIGLMMATGNVGEYLSDRKDSDTFITSDAGVTWKSVKKGPYMWEFGDQGSIVVIVNEREATNVVFISQDEGDTWEPYEFYDKEIKITDLTTVPSDTSRNFLLWGKDGDQLVAINLDFSGLTDTQCKLDEEDVEAGDYYLWTPKHPKQGDDDCLFGHVSQYHRKKISSNCYNGRMIPHLHDIARNCSCSRRDFECDYNYERQVDGSCKLVPGLKPADHSESCKLDPDQIEYYAPTGYRRLALSTCEGGREMDLAEAFPCPGHDDEFKKKHGPSAWGIFFAVTIPIVVATGVGYWVWKNWNNKFGQIRLGEQASFDSEAPYIKYPVLVIAAIVAVAQAIPLLVSSLWRSASSMLSRGGSKRFTTRDSFARGRGDYAVVDDDEGELLGDESDEEV